MSQLPSGLQTAHVLIVEDEPYIAFDLVHAVEQAGGVAIGPAVTVHQALDLIAVARGTIHGAILDVNLPDGHIGPVLEALLPAVPVIIHSGVGLPLDVQSRFPEVPTYTKPTPPPALANELASMLAARRSDG